MLFEGGEWHLKTHTLAVNIDVIVTCAFRHRIIPLTNVAKTLCQAMKSELLRVLVEGGKLHQNNVKPQCLSIKTAVAREHQTRAKRGTHVAKTACLPSKSAFREWGSASFSRPGNVTKTPRLSTKTSLGSGTWQKHQWGQIWADLLKQRACRQKVNFESRKRAIVAITKTRNSQEITIIIAKRAVNP